MPGVLWGLNRFSGAPEMSMALSRSDICAVPRPTALATAADSDR